VHQRRGAAAIGQRAAQRQATSSEKYTASLRTWKARRASQRQSGCLATAVVRPAAGARAGRGGLVLVLLHRAAMDVLAACAGGVRHAVSQQRLLPPGVAYSVPAP
jgi:hypothetical protein